MSRRSTHRGKYRRITTSLLLLAASGRTFAQELQIASPSERSLVTPGQILYVNVTATSSAFRSIALNTPSQTGSPVTVTAAPYRFSIPISPEFSSGIYPLAATGTPEAGGDAVYSVISIDVERTTKPRQLISELPAISFEYAGACAPMVITGVFPDDSQVLVTHSTYISYSSDAPTVVKVDSTGQATSVAPGKANVIVRYGNSSIGAVSLRIPAFVPRPITVVPAESSLSVSQMREFTAQLAMDPDLEQSVRWSIDPPVGSIDDRGLYTAPSSLAARLRVTVTATSVADPIKAGSGVVWILPTVRHKP